MTERRSAKEPLYPGALNEPLEPKVNPRPIVLGEHPDDVASVEANDQTDYEWRLEYDEKFDLLCDHFSIARDDPERWMKLALALAKLHVPGFQEKRSETRGRRRKWESSDEFALWYEFDVLIKSGKTERQAAKILLERHPNINASKAALLIRLKRFDKTLNI